MLGIVLLAFRKDPMDLEIELCTIYIVQKYGEFIAAPTADHTGKRKCFSQNVRELADDLVSELVAQGIVDLL